jgi:hypothetical protein
MESLTSQPAKPSPPSTRKLNEMSLSHLTRFLVYRSAKSPNYLCVCAARDKRHALKIARGIWNLKRDAYAVTEVPTP